MDTIINRVAKSPLQIFDLEDYYPEKIEGIDIAQWLQEGYVLMETNFRTALKNHNWTIYGQNYIYLYCSTEAIVPAWAYSLITTYLQPLCPLIVQGSSIDLLQVYYQTILTSINYENFVGKPTLLKGCSRKNIPDSIYVLATQQLQKYASSILYGEACAAVPLFKPSSVGK